MPEALTPKDLADAIGVSESSLRRWVDSGRIRTYRTAGGHRRIPVEEGLRFIRESGSTVVRPELLGLAATQAPHSVADQLFAALEAGDADRAAGTVLAQYMAGESLSSLCDGPIRHAMSRIGELWTHCPRGILQEHRATRICGDILHQLLQLQPPAQPDAPLALGGAADDDLYTLPSQMVCLVLTGLGFRAIDYGPNTPSDLLSDAAREHGASLVWRSISVDLPKEQLRQQLHRLTRQLHDLDVLLVIGGRHARDINLGDAPNVIHGSSMVQLAEIGKGIMAGHRAARRATARTRDALGQATDSSPETPPVPRAPE